MADLLPPVDGASILANARAVRLVLEAEAAASEAGRQLTPRAVEALRSAGVFRMPMPRSWGGPEVDPPTQVEIIEALAEADGSAGWCAMIGSDSGFYSAALDDAAGRALYPDLDMITAGWIFPGGQLTVAGDGYRLSGRWQFGSGCTHADVIIGGAVVIDDGQMVTSGAGLPASRVVLLPADRYEIIDTWHTTGLAGSGSHDYAIDDAAVPAGQSFAWTDARRDGALYAWPGLFAVNLLGVPLGIARRALDDAHAHLGAKMLTPEMVPARDDPRVRTAVATANAMVGSARSYVFDVVGDFWATLAAGDEPTLRQRGTLVGCYGHTVRTCRDAVSVVADTIGTASIFRANPIERAQRDLATISQHILAQPRTLATAGALLLDGADLTHPLIAQRLF